MKGKLEIAETSAETHISGKSRSIESVTFTTKSTLTSFRQSKKSGESVSEKVVSYVGANWSHSIDQSC